MAKVKITVIKKLKTEDIYGGEKPRTSLSFVSPCPAVEEGATFVTKEGECPEGFCPWAFADIQRDIVHLTYGGDYPWVAEKGVAYSACTDGLRPVIFKLERIE